MAGPGPTARASSRAGPLAGPALARRRSAAVVRRVRSAHRVVEFVQEPARRFEVVLGDAVVRPTAVAPTADQAGLAQHCEVLRDRRLCVGQRLLEVTRADRAARWRTNSSAASTPTRSVSARPARPDIVAQ